MTKAELIRQLDNVSDDTKILYYLDEYSSFLNPKLELTVYDHDVKIENSSRENIKAGELFVYIEVADSE